MSNQPEAQPGGPTLGALPGGDDRWADAQGGTDPPPDTERSVGRTLVSGGLWNLLSTIFPIATSVCITPYAIHGLGVERWGLYILVLTISMFFGPANSGIVSTVNRFLAVYAGRGDRVKATQTVLTTVVVLTGFGAIITTVGWYLSPTVIGLFGVHGRYTGEATFLLRTLGVLVTVSLLHNQFAGVLYAHHRWALSNLAYLGAAAVWAVGLVATVHFDWGLRGVAIVFIAQQALPTIVLVPFALGYLTRAGLRFLSWTEIKEMATFSASAQAVGLIELFNTTFDTLLVGGFFKVRTLAYFNTGSNFSTQLREVPINLAGPAGTHLARVYGRDGDDAALEAFGALQHIWVVVCTGFAFVSMGAAYFAVVAWLGPGFGMAGEFALILMAGNTANLWVEMLTQHVAAVGRPDLEVRFTVVSVVLNAALTVPLAFISVLGIPVATALGAVLANPYFTYIVRRRYRADVPSFVHDVPVLPALLGCGVTVVLELAIRHHIPDGPLGLLCCAVPAGIGLLVFTAAVLRRQTATLVRLLLQRPFALGPVAQLFLDDRHRPHAARGPTEGPPPATEGDHEPDPFLPGLREEPGR